MDKHTVIVRKVVRHSHDVVNIFFTLPNNSVLSYTAGQYVTVYFDGTTTPEGKAYSLSSMPSEKLMSIAVKKIGEYSGKLHALKKGDSFEVSSAYGFFNPLTKRPLVCLGAGVGIAPIWSVIKNELEQEADRIVHVFYSNKTTGDIVFKDELAKHSNLHKELAVQHHITRQPSAPAHVHKGRINLDECVEVAKDAAYMLCGSVDFVRSMWQGLLARGVPQELISTETFFEQ